MTLTYDELFHHYQDLFHDYEMEQMQVAQLQQALIEKDHSLTDVGIVEKLEPYLARIASALEVANQLHTQDLNAQIASAQISAQKDIRKYENECVDSTVHNPVKSNVNTVSMHRHRA